jgi:transposase InsO family protein
MKVHFLKLKSEALSALKDYEMELRRQTPGAKIKKLHSHRGREYLSTEFDIYLKNQGINHQLTVHHSPQQNGVAECLSRTLVEHAQAMLLGQDMPKILWVEALNYATWLKNHLPSHATPGKTPHELVNKSKPNLTLAHEFSTPVYVHVITGGD